MRVTVRLGVMFSVIRRVMDRFRGQPVVQAVFGLVSPTSQWLRCRSSVVNHCDPVIPSRTPAMRGRGLGVGSQCSVINSPLSRCRPFFDQAGRGCWMSLSPPLQPSPVSSLLQLNALKALTGKVAV